MTAAQHATQRGTDEAKAGGEVDVEHRLPILVAHAHRETVAGDAGIVDEDVELAERGLALADEALGFVGSGKIGGEDVAAFAELGGQRRARRLRVPASITVAPWRVQRAGDRAADAARRTGDERLLVRRDRTS